MSIADVKALTFDVFGTVVNWRDSIAREAKTFLQPRGHELDWHGFADAWRGRYQPGMDKIRYEGRPWTKLDVLHRENLVEVLAQFHIEGLSEDEISTFTNAWQRLDPWPDTVAGLTRLKRKYILGTLSNGNISLMVKMAKYAGLPWDVILGAEIAQSYKPLGETYDRSVEALDLAPGEVALVAAHNSDLVAAASRGLRTCYVNRPLEDGPNKKRDLRAEHDFDVIATSMEDLADKLGC